MTETEAAKGSSSHTAYFADALRLAAGLGGGAAEDRTLAAFATVRREAFAGPGPWKYHPPLSGPMAAPIPTPDDDPRWLYHNVLLVLDEEKGINIGLPALWARFFARTGIGEGARILQIGAGVGYYTAILRRLAGLSGRVVAYEVDGPLVARARSNLIDFDGVAIREGDAARDLDDDGPFDLIVSFAGVTHVPRLWADRLAPDGRLLLPLTGTDGWGAMILAKRSPEGFEATTLGRVGFYDCASARDPALAERVDVLFSDPDRLSGAALRIIVDADRVRFEARANRDGQPRG